MFAFFRDLRYSIRALRVHAGFTLAASATMAIAISATTAMFSIINPVLLQPLPFQEPDRLVSVDTMRVDTPGRLRGVSLQELQDWRDQSRTIEAFAGWRDWGLSRYDGTAGESVFGAIVTPDIFKVLPVRPQLGRLFNDRDDVPGRNQIVLLSDGYWRTRFGADPTVIGHTLVLERGPKAVYTIAGVLPPAFTELPSFEDVQLFALSSIDPDAGLRRDLRNRRVLARLRKEAVIGAARQEMQSIGRQLAREYPETNQAWEIAVRPLIQAEIGPIGGALRTLFAAVGFVLLIACTNVAALQLTRALSRRHEFAIRQAIGGSRLDIARALIAEGILIALVGTAAGVILATWLLDAIVASGPNIPRASHVSIDTSVLAFAVTAGVAAGLLIALPASLLTTRADLSRGLKEDAGRLPSVGAQRWRLAFVAAQLALTLILLAGAALSTQTFARLVTVHPGFDPHNLAMISVVVPNDRKGSEVSALYVRVLEEIRGIPGVRAASAVSAGPSFGGIETIDVRVEGDSPTNPSQPARYFNVATGYFRTLGIPLKSGRDFSTDDGASSPSVAIVNDAFVRHFLGARDPIGARVFGPRGDVVSIVGVSGDVLQDLRSRNPIVAEIYFPYTQRPRWAAFIVVRGDDLAAILPGVRDRIGSADLMLRVGSPSIMGELMARATRAPRFTMFLLGAFALVGLLLSAIGVYALVSFSSGQRTREIGVRLSLGGTRRDIINLLARGGLSAVVGGATVGVVGAVAISRMMASTLPQMEPLSVAVLAVTWTVLVIVGTLACYIPARRAMRIDPATALRVP